MKYSFSRFFTLFAIIIMALFTVGCSRSYKIEAIASDDCNGKKVYIIDALSGDFIDSAVVADGKAVLNGKIDSVCMALFVGAGDYPITFFLEPGNISILTDSNRVSGTKFNNDFYGLVVYDKDVQRLSEECERIRAELYTDTSIAKRIDVVNRFEAAKKEMIDEMQKKCLDLYKSHKKDILGAYLLYIAAQSMTFEEFAQMYEDASKAVKSFVPLAEYYDYGKSGGFDEPDEPTEPTGPQPGDHFIDFNGTNYATGKSASLASMIEGKIVVIDFWASWCRPCREEITTTLIPLYEEYKAKGVEVIGVDVSDKPEDHDKAVKELGIKYPQLIDSDNVAAGLYGFRGIPWIIVIDRTGNIVAVNVRGEAIRAELDKLLVR